MSNPLTRNLRRCHLRTASVCLAVTGHAGQRAERTVPSNRHRRCEAVLVEEMASLKTRGQKTAAWFQG
eukprot:594966-Rhodomonas_salina.2